MHFKHLALFLMCMLLTGNLATAAGQHMMQSRVPADKLDEARSLTNPLPQSADILAKGKAIYEGKGTCVNCHGITGHGDGPGAANLNPAPRVFRSRGFWRHRTEGEIFWVVKHGSPGTAMIAFGGLLSDEEIWTVIQYEQSFARRHGRGSGMGRHRGMGPRSDNKGPGKHGRKRGIRHHKGDEGQNCCE